MLSTWLARTRFVLMFQLLGSSFVLWFELQEKEGSRLADECEKTPGGSMRKCVAAVLFGAGSVAPNPRPRDFVAAAFAEEHLPKIAIRYRHAARGYPSSLNPRDQVPRHCPLDVLRVRDNFNNATFFQRRKSSDHGLEFHAIVGGVRFRADKYLFDRTTSQQTCPGSRAWISETRSVREHNRSFHK